MKTNSLDVDIKLKKYQLFHCRDNLFKMGFEPKSHKEFIFQKNIVLETGNNVFCKAIIINKYRKINLFIGNYLNSFKEIKEAILLLRKIEKRIRIKNDSN
jgi:hypothetical protein